jgi:myo-inositol-1(or 4)-monophosphatase
VSDLDLERLGALAERAALAGGAIVEAHFGAAGNVQEKAPGDWVSDVDTASETAIRDLLAQETPEIPFFGEESGGVRSSLEWVVDPLDGTTNFLHRFRAVGVSVALVRDGAPIVGVVHAPLLDETYRAVLGGGAFCNGTPIEVSERPPSGAIVATGFPFRHKELTPRYLAMFRAAFGSFEDLRRAGAASLDLAWTAAGVFDGFFELSLGPWDVAAGALLVREAGGVVTDWAADPEAWLSSGNIAAGTPAVRAEIVRLAEESAADPQLS